MPRLASSSVDLILCDLPYGTAGLACRNTGRKFIGIERDQTYFDIAVNRLKSNDLFLPFVNVCSVD